MRSVIKVEGGYKKKVTKEKDYKNENIMDHYLYVSSNDSEEEYPDNAPQHFTVQLTREIDLSGTWYCALKELYFKGEFRFNPKGLFHTPKKVPQHLYLCTDVIEGTVVSNSYVPVLKRTEIKKKLERVYVEPLYFKVNVPRLSKLTIYALDQDLNPVIFKKSPLTCLLHFTKRCPHGPSTS